MKGCEGASGPMTDAAGCKTWNRHEFNKGAQFARGPNSHPRPSASESARRRPLVLRWSRALRSCSQAAFVELQAREVRRCAREFPEFGLFLSRQLAAAVGRLSSIIEEFAFKTVSQRVASHLISLSEPTPITGERTAHVTQAALAEYVGSAREVVCRSLRSLSEEGLVTIGRGSVRIIEPTKLQRLAGQP